MKNNLPDKFTVWKEDVNEFVLHKVTYNKSVSYQNSNGHYERAVMYEKFAEDEGNTTIISTEEATKDYFNALKQEMLELPEMSDITSEQLDVVKAYCDALDMDDDNNSTGFEFEGQFITNVFLSPCGRFENNIYEAVATYCVENVKDFCKQVLDLERNEKSFDER